MADSYVSTSRANLIREMSRDMHKKRTSSDSTVSSQPSIHDTLSSGFDPENEALMSTRQFENSANNLPDLRASAKKYRNYTLPDGDYAINTAALSQVLPDFSQGSGSSAGEDASVEIGRGEKKNKGAENASRRDDSCHSSNAMIGDYRVMYTPPLSSSRKGSKRANGKDLRKDVQVRLASLSQKENHEPVPRVSKASELLATADRPATKSKRPTLSEMHNRATQQDDGYLVGNEPPETMTVTARTTRFASGNHGPTNKPARTDALLEQLNRNNIRLPMAAQKGNGTQTINSVPENTTHQSYMLPDLPNLSELVSGVFQDGTPVFSKHGKPQTSRFASQSAAAENLVTPRHPAIDTIPIPDDEKAIFVSLKLLQDRVAELERGKAEAEQKAHEMQQENMLLKAARKEQRRHRRSDSALGVSEEASDDGDNDARTTSKAAQKVLQVRVDNANRKVAVSELTIKNLSQERDAAVARLGVAFYNSEELKKENEQLRKENNDLRAETAQLSAEHQLDADRWARKEAKLVERARQHEEDVRAIHEKAKTIWESRSSMEDDATMKAPTSRKSRDNLSEHVRATSKPSPQKAKQVKISGRIDDEISRLSKQHAEDQLFSVDAGSLGHPSHSETKRVETRRQPSHQERPLSRTAQQAKVRHVVAEELEDSDESASDMETQTGAAQSVRISNFDVTDLSLVGDRDMAEIRRILEEERAARKGHLPSSNRDPIRTEQIRSIFSTKQAASASTLPRKSSMKTLINNPSGAAEKAREPTLTGRLSLYDEADVSGNISRRLSERKGRKSQQSVRDDTRQSRRSAPPEMTSAFILPDITLRDASSAFPELSKEARRVLDEVSPHTQDNCTVCKRVITEGATLDHNDGVKETIKVQKPVPVSDRMPSPRPYNEEPTIRPSQPPALALATVMKGLEHERQHLFHEQKKWQAIYNQHDPALSKRRRKAVSEKLATIARALEEKSDQIYALYDVLEGQKRSGDLMNEEEVEVTLLNLGITVNHDQTIRSVHEPTNDATVTEKQGHRELREDDSSSEDELPWEGIETTEEVTGRSNPVGSLRRRQDSNAV